MTLSVVVTGSSGFIGFHLSKLLLEEGNKVHGIDCMNNYYDVKLKKARFNILNKYAFSSESLQPGLLKLAKKSPLQIL